ncbi:MAG: DNA alkylation repair protein [Muribaculaceae bacterium]|nr:DNA alkylation repair protein [Muribaculaceae bacterium]
MTKFDLIRSTLEKNGDPERAAGKAAYMRNKFPFFGLVTPKLRLLCKPFFAEALKSGVIDWELLDRCWDDDHREMQYFVADYLRQMKKHLRYEDIPRIERYIRTKQWWDTIDSLDITIGYIGLTDPRVSELMLKWSVDPDFWVRRVAIDHQLTLKTATDTDLLETILVNNFGSKEFFINKAIGWSLRDYSKTNPQWVRDFINRHGSKMSRLSIREGSKYI